MKKTLLIIVLGSLLLVGCGSGKYKEGTYEGSAADNYGGQSNIATARVEVGSDGKIKSVFLDTTYTTRDGVTTTKKELQYNYGMKNQSANLGVIEDGAEWFEQVENLEKKVVEKQGIEFIEWTDNTNTKTDSVAGCTIDISALYEALNNALEKAKK